LAVTVNRNDSVYESSSFARFEDVHARCRALGEGLTDLLHELPPTETLSVEHATVQVLMQRAVGWMHSLGKLERVFDYQAHSSGCRALLEVAVDVALITHEPALHERMRAFEESGLLKAAVKYKRFVDKVGLANPDEAQLRYLAANERRVTVLRQKFWNSGGHPRTWLGPAFPDVAAEADRRAGTKYEQFYYEHYDRLCWATHGSTLMMLRTNPNMLADVSGMALVGSLQLTMGLVERALRFLGYDSVEAADKLAARQLAASRKQQADRLTAIANRAESST